MSLLSICDYSIEYTAIVKKVRNPYTNECILFCLQLSTSVVFKLYFQIFPPKTSSLLCCHCVLVPVTIFLLSHWLIIGHTHNAHSPNNCFSIMGMILNIEVNIYTKYKYS